MYIKLVSHLNAIYYHKWRGVSCYCISVMRDRLRIIMTIGLPCPDDHNSQVLTGVTPDAERGDCYT